MPPPEKNNLFACYPQGGHGLDHVRDTHPSARAGTSGMPSARCPAGTERRPRWTPPRGEKRYNRAALPRIVVDFGSARSILL